MSNELKFINDKVDNCINGLRKDLITAACKEDFEEIRSIHLQLDMIYMFGEWVEKAIEMSGDDGN